MSQLEKLLIRLYSKPKDFTYDELKKILNYYDFFEDNKGMTSGSRVRFKHKDGTTFLLHKPHPSNIINMFTIKDLILLIEERSNYYD